MVWTDLVAGATRRLVHGLHRGLFDGQACPAHTENSVQLVNTLTRSGEAKGCAKEPDVGATRLRHPYMITLKSGYNPGSMLTITNSCAWASLFGGSALDFACHREPL